MERIIEPPIEIYGNDGCHIADASGHLCTADNTRIAIAIVAALNLALKAEEELDDNNRT